MAMHLKEEKPKTLTKLGDVAENYVEAYATNIVFGLDPKMPKFSVAPKPLHDVATDVVRPAMLVFSVHGRLQRKGQ